jgi:hypothetical protein
MATKKSTLTKEKIITLFMDYRLENSTNPKSVYQFTKLNGFEEKDFYNSFGTLESVEKEIFRLFIEKTITLIKKDTNYEEYEIKNKILSFYFTFFELLSANRSYFVMYLSENSNDLKKIVQLSACKDEFLKFISEIISEEVNSKNGKYENFQRKAIQETSWIQFLLTLKFWLHDESAGFEKTDMCIEKSVNATFELINITPLDNLFDFGKFIFKEKIYANR